MPGGPENMRNPIPAFKMKMHLARGTGTAAKQKQRSAKNEDRSQTRMRQMQAVTRHSYSVSYPQQQPKILDFDVARARICNRLPILSDTEVEQCFGRAYFAMTTRKQKLLFCHAAYASGGERTPTRVSATRGTKSI